MFFYLSCLRPPLAQAPPSSPVTITPQIANDLRTEPFGSVQDLYYSWLHEVPGKPPVFTATTKLTTYRQATAYKEIPVPVPKGLKENQQWTLVLTASSRSPPECTLPLGADDIGSTPFAALSMPITFTSKAGKWGQKQEQIERIYSFSVTRTLKAQEESTESASAPQILKVSLRIREQTSFDLDKKIWDSGIGLSSWLVRIAGDRDVDFASSSVAEAGLNRLKDILSVNRAQRILELGSGIGIVSLVLAALREGKVPSGEPQDEILSTDLDTAIPLLGHNIAANKRFYLSVDLKAAVLDWEGDLSQIGNNQRFDFVVMADVTYNTSSFPVLVNTLRSIVEANPDTRPCFLLGYKQRDESERSLWDMAKAIGLHFAQPNRTSFRHRFEYMEQTKLRSTTTLSAIVFFTVYKHGGKATTKDRGKEVTHFHEQSFEELQEYQGRKRQEFEERLRGGQGKVEEWIDYGSWEVSQNNLARSRSVFERALDVDTHSVAQQPCIPEILWKAYIDLELGHGDREAVRRLYERLVQLSPNAKVWMSYALFEAQEKVDDDDKDKDVVQGDVPLARAIFRRGVDTLEGPDRRLQRLELLGAWEAFEEAHGPHEELEKVREKATSEHSARVSDGGEGMDPAGLKLLQDAQLCPTSES